MESMVEQLLSTAPTTIWIVGITMSLLVTLLVGGTLYYRRYYRVPQRGPGENDDILAAHAARQAYEPTSATTTEANDEAEWEAQLALRLQRLESVFDTLTTRIMEMDRPSDDAMEVLEVLSRGTQAERRSAELVSVADLSDEQKSLIRRVGGSVDEVAGAN